MDGPTPTPEPTPEATARLTIGPPLSAILIQVRRDHGVSYIDVGTIGIGRPLETIASISDPSTLGMLDGLDERYGIVTVDGRLAIDATESDPATLIFDVFESVARRWTPTEVPVEGGLIDDARMVWGPGGLLAGWGLEGVTIVDTTSGVASRLGIEGDVPAGWLADGSGVVVTSDGSDGKTDTVLLLDGSSEALAPPFPTLMTRPGERLFGAAGEHLRYPTGDGTTSGSRSTRVVAFAQESGEAWGRETTTGYGVWDATGVGLWFVDDPDAPLDGQLARPAFLRHYAAPNQRDRNVRFMVTDAFLNGPLALAPDDSFALVQDYGGGTWFVDLADGRSTSLRGWTLAGWTTGFPDYPVAP